ncbi:MAG: O-antigen ligase family protein [Parcubacteria group bacterium]|jgi:O-antigen ligase
MKKWLNLENFLYLTIFLLPSYLIKLSFFGLPTNVLEILIVVALGWAFLKRSFRNFLKLRFRITVGIILAGLVISTLVNGNYLAGAGIIKGWFVLPIIFALIVKNVVPQEKLNNIYLTLYFSGVVFSVVSLAQYFLGRVTFDGRLEGIFNSPNYLAMYLAPMIIIGVLSIKYQVSSIFKKISLGVILIVFYLTYSYAAWIAVGVTLAGTALLEGEKRINFKKLALVFLAIVVLILAQWNNQKFVDLRNASERSSLNSRVMIWQSAGKTLLGNWLVGIGPGNFQEKYLENQKHFPPYLEWAVPHPHNLYLAFWLYAGVFGVVGFFALLYVWFKEIAQKEKDMLWRISLGIMVYILLHGLVDTTYFKNDLACIFWLNFIILL